MSDQPLLLDIPDQLETDRLLLRPPRAGDGPVINAAIQESLPELRLWMPWAYEGQTLEQSETFARESAAKFTLREMLNFMLWRRVDMQFVGMCGMFDFNWSIPSCEIGYWQRTSMSGQGYVTEAVNALTDFAFETLGAQRVQIRLGADNHRSAGVAERAGYTLEGTLRNTARNIARDNQLEAVRVYARIPEK